MPSNRRLIVVANRLPVRRVSGGETRWVASEGGLVTALAPIARSTHGAWVGWSGASDRRTARFTHDGIAIQPLALSEREVESFYHEFSNRTLWPLYHDAIRTPEFDRRHWGPYVEVNMKYARAAARIARKGDIVWVHDYHLQLVPEMIRRMRPGVRIGFFLHIPFPPEEIFAWLPWRTEILRGLLGADLVGFQTTASAKNFAALARKYTPAEGTDHELEIGGRRVAVGSFPISIDADWFESTAKLPRTITQAKALRSRIGAKRKILLAVDRLDYTKGIDARLQAYELLLGSGRLTVEDVCLMQIAVPSRERVFEYADMREQIERLVGRINGEFAVPGSVAVHYFRRSFTREELTAFYVAADVMVVTPLRDGMNLVAKEYVACRPEASGALILSEFAGAAQELRRAILVNPRDVEGVADAMHYAVKMSKKEAQHRMGILRTQVRRHDVYDWARSFMEAMRS
jgi:trehalose 6-phosphate synthase